MSHYAFLFLWHRVRLVHTVPAVRVRNKNNAIDGWCLVFATLANRTVRPRRPRGGSLFLVHTRYGARHPAVPALESTTDTR